MKKQFILLLAALSLATVAFGQEVNTGIKGRWTVRFSHLFDNVSNKPNSGLWKALGHNTLDANYGFGKFGEVGLYLGAYKYLSVGGSGTGFQEKDAFFLSYGTQANIHALPFLEKKADSRFDVYAKARLGFASALSEKGYLPGRATSFVGGIGAGASVFLTKQLGINGEYLYNYNSKGKNGQGVGSLGVIYKFPIQK
jgi:hypothetical protein